jgi:hypothetical protein
MGAVAGRLEEIVKSMSTQYVGPFPKNMDSITPIVEKAAKSLDIMVDFAAYGHYSRPNEFEKYLTSLKHRQEAGVRIRMLIYGKDAAENSQDSQYSQFKGSFEKEEMVKDRFQIFFEKCYPGLPTPSTWQDFNRIIDKMQEECQRALIERGVEIRVVPGTMVMFLWIEDHEEAAFAFLNSGPEYRELTFRTQDKNLIEVFLGLYEDTWAKATRLSLDENGDPMKGPFPTCVESPHQSITSTANFTEG